MLTVAYMTNRREPMAEWFLDSLHRECGGAYAGIKIVVVDFYADDPGRKSAFQVYARHQLTHVTPKACVWQGHHRLTKINYFAAANARNTAICLAPDGWIVFVDDLSVLLPGWLSAVRQAMAENYIVFGAYKKVKDLVVENGNVISFTPYPQGVDSRWNSGRDDGPVPAAGSWLFGCSFAAPVEALLAVNGLDENCDSTGVASEDCILGIRLQNAGFKFKYDRRMLTYESEERHHYTVSVDGVRMAGSFRGMDKGVSPNDKSHAILKQAMESKWAPNYFGEGGIRALRQRVLSGEPFPICQIPDRDWWDGQPLSEL